MSTSDIEKKMVKISLDNGHPKSVVRAHTLPVQGNVSNKKKMGDKSTASTRTRASLMRYVISYLLHYYTGGLIVSLKGSYNDDHPCNIFLKLNENLFMLHGLTCHTS